MILKKKIQILVHLFDKINISISAEPQQQQQYKYN